MKGAVTASGRRIVDEGAVGREREKGTLSYSRRRSGRRGGRESKGRPYLVKGAATAGGRRIVYGGAVGRERENLSYSRRKAGVEEVESQEGGHTW